MMSYEISTNDLNKNNIFELLSVDEFNRLDLPRAYQDIKQPNNENVVGVLWARYPVQNTLLKYIKIHSSSRPNNTECCVFRFENNRLLPQCIHSSEGASREFVCNTTTSSLCILVFENIDGIRKYAPLNKYGFDGYGRDLSIHIDITDLPRDRDNDRIDTTLEANFEGICIVVACACIGGVVFYLFSKAKEKLPYIVGHENTDIIINETIEWIKESGY
jgi:hypothetical protein